jgi:uncharacterized membrane protein
MDVKSKIFEFIAAHFSEELTTALIATLPIFELRLAVPVGILKFGLPAIEVYFLSLLGNLVPVIPLLLLFKYFFNSLQELKFVGKFFRWWFARVERKSKIVERWGFWGLVVFVAIPLPVTGAWTGTVAATLFEMKIKKAFLAISVGVAIAGIAVSLLSLLAADIIQSWLTFA